MSLPRIESFLSPCTSDSDDSDYSPKMRKLRPKSSSYIALRDAVYQLTCLNDFNREKIGDGFFADVYKVTHKTTGEVMVLKMNKCRKNSKQMLAEIQLMNRLSHPNILGFKGSCVHEGHLHALTEFINAGTLEELLKNIDINLSWSVRIKLAHDIASGMAYLHSKGVFHRDLTSKNCLIHRSSDGKLSCIVADFGLAAKIKHKRRSYTETVGSPFWMAPECLKGREYGEQADVFSYGIILAEIMSRLSADPDFLPRTSKFGVDYDGLRPYCGDCPTELWDLMWQCSQLDPDDRPTFNEAVFRLQQLMSKYSCKSSPTLSSSQSENCLATPTEETHQSDESPKTNSPNFCPSPTDLDAQLSSLLEGSFHETTDGCYGDSSRGNRFIPVYNNNNNKRILTSQDVKYHTHEKGGGGDSGIDPGVYWKNNLALAKTPSLNESLTTPMTPPFSQHVREVSDSSEASFQLPSPSFAWAPPPTPIRHLTSLENSGNRPSVSSLDDGSLSSPENSPTYCRHRKLSPAYKQFRYSYRVGESPDTPTTDGVGVVHSDSLLEYLSGSDNGHVTGSVCGVNEKKDNSFDKLPRTCYSTPNLCSC